MSGAKPWRVYDRKGWIGAAFTLEEAQALVTAKFGWACAVDQRTATRIVRKFCGGRWQWMAGGYDATVRKRLARAPAEDPAPARNLPYRDD